MPWGLCSPVRLLGTEFIGIAVGHHVGAHASSTASWQLPVCAPMSILQLVVSLASLSLSLGEHLRYLACVHQNVDNDSLC